MIRNQLLAVVLMTVLFVGYFYFFMDDMAPPPPPAERAPLEEALDEPDRAPAPLAIEEEIAGADQGLPPVAAPPADPVDDEVTLRDEYVELVFTRVGARLKRANIILGEEGRASQQLVPVPDVDDDAAASYPLSLRFEEDFLGDALNVRRWEVTPGPDERSATFTLTLPNLARIEKTFSLTDTPYVVDMAVTYTNASGEPQRLGRDDRVPAYSIVWGPDVTSGDATKGVHQEVTWRVEGEDAHIQTADLEDTGELYYQRVNDPTFVAIKSAYFIVAMRPLFEQPQGWVTGEPDNFYVGLGVPRLEMAPGEAVTETLQLYVGPTHLEALEAAWPGLDTTLRFFASVDFMDWFSKLLLSILNWFYYSIFSNYGIAIIFLTVLVRSVVFPLTYKSMVSMKKMQKLAPDIEQIRKEHADDPQEAQKKMMEMYRERGVNPLGGCFPMLLQMPVFFALYRMLWSAFELRGAPFMLWINDLSQPDRMIMLPVEIPVPFTQAPIDAINLLPILMGVSMVASQKLMPMSGASPNPQQKMIMTLMPVLFSVICYTMPAGLNLYILTSTLLGIGQNYLVRTVDIDADTKKKKKRPTGKPRHFYNAAQARKREIAKENRRRKAQGTTRAKKDSDGSGQKGA